MLSCNLYKMNNNHNNNNNKKIINYNMKMKRAMKICQIIINLMMKKNNKKILTEMSILLLVLQMSYKRNKI